MGVLVVGVVPVVLWRRSSRRVMLGWTGMVVELGRPLAVVLATLLS